MRNMLHLFYWISGILVLICGVAFWKSLSYTETHQSHLKAIQSGYAQKTPEAITAVAKTVVLPSKTDIAEETLFPEKDGKKVAAYINGEPIYDEEVSFVLDPNSFGAMKERAYGIRLEMLINNRMVGNYLRQQKLEVPKKAVDQEIEKMRRNPPALGGCSCCRYPSLESFLIANMMTFPDLEETIRNDLGLQMVLDKRWQEEAAGEGVQKRLDAERYRVVQECVKLSHIFFNTVQKADFASDPDGVRLLARALAEKAQLRIKAGESFEKVAEEVSEDANSRVDGGRLGCVPKSALGNEVEKVALALKPGEISPPTESPWGFHILRRETIIDQDVLDLMKTEYLNQRRTALLQLIQQKTQVKRF